MNPQIIHKSVTKARKEYPDDGWEDIQNWNGWSEKNTQRPLPFSERRMLVKYTRQKGNKGHRILKGEIYERQFNSYEGDTYVWRTKKVFYDFLCKYDLFPEL